MHTVNNIFYFSKRFMRKIILAAGFWLTVFGVSAQLSGGNSPKCKRLEKISAGKDTVQVFIFDKLDNNAKVRYEGNADNFEWFGYDGQSKQSSDSKDFFQLEDDKGYYVQELATGRKIYFWVIDYSARRLNLNKLEVDNSQTDCKNLTLTLSSDNYKDLIYRTYKGQSYKLDARKFTLSYTSMQWSNNTWSASSPTQAVAVLSGTTPITVPAPLCDTEFSLTGDQYADELGLSPTTIKTSQLYTAVAVECHPTSVTTTRDATNENDRPKATTQISGSGPMEIQFLSNANLPTTLYYKWEIFKDKALQPYITRVDKDIRNTFNESGSYKVKITVNSKDTVCTDTASITVDISESYIKVPNVFTPNGDGYNDEFRVAFKSIKQFEAWVYNRWGRLVYKWNDPAKGWDGNIGGKKASPGAYFYIMKAVGTDGKKYKLKGDINLLRGE